jgi:hypothetical protein
MRKKHKHIEPDHYIVVNIDNQVYTGMIRGFLITQMIGLKLNL